MNTIDCPKCNHEHKPTGSHEEDKGTTECESCGFQFYVEIEYEPTYSTSCVTHQMEVPKQIQASNGETINVQFCKHCGHCEIL